MLNSFWNSENLWKNYFLHHYSSGFFISWSHLFDLLWSFNFHYPFTFINKLGWTFTHTLNATLTTLPCRMITAVCSSTVRSALPRLFARTLTVASLSQVILYFNSFFKLLIQTLSCFYFFLTWHCLSSPFRKYQHPNTLSKQEIAICSFAECIQFDGICFCPVLTPLRVLSL